MSVSRGYVWRRLTPSQKEIVMRHRRLHGQPCHSPPHWRENAGHRFFLLSASCWEHEPHIGHTPDRLSSFTEAWLALLHGHCEQVLAWCVLPNHYHALIETADLPRLLTETGRFHGRTSRVWNREEGTPGRTNFYRCFERAMRSEAHQEVTVNYIHHNPVHHGYVERWPEWPWSSAQAWLQHHGREEMTRRWLRYPLLDYGQGWDAAEL